MARVQVRPASVSDFEVLCTIGSGSYGTVKKVKRIKDNKIFVWKELDYSAANDSDKNMLVSEVNLLRELKHENIVRYIDRIIDKKSSTLFLIMEFCEGGDLATYITKTKKEGQVIEESFVWRVCRQLAGAIKECHSRCRYGKSVLHRDLKPANIFLDSRFNVKLGDFGLARVLKHESSFAKTCVGTPLYMSPEQMLGKEYNEKSDIWALGCLLYELCCLKPPFTAGNQVELAAKVHSGSYEEIPRCYSAEVKSLVRSLLTVNKDKRPSIDILMECIASKEASSPNDEEERNPSPAPSSASPSEESEHLKREVERLRQELNRKDRELKSKSSELEAAYKDVEERNRKLNLREKRLLLGERLALEKLMRIERMNKVNVEISPEMSPRNADPENSVPQVPEENSPWRRVSSPSVVQPHRRTAPNPEKPKKEDIENAVPRAGDIRSEHPLTSPRVVLHAPPITGRQRAVKSDDRKPLRRLDQVGHCPGHLPKTSTPVRPFPEDLLTRGC